jgi:DNA polymerase-3 subunit alpha
MREPLPIPQKLLFERFLNRERVSMPDIDFDDRRRGEMIRYATEKYGAAWRR